MAELYRSDICEVDVSKSLVRSYAGIVLATGDCKANRFGAVVVRNGEPVDLSTAAVTGYFIRPNYETVVCEGAKDGNIAYVDLPAACYTHDGTFSLAIKIVSTEVTQTVRVIDGCIRLTQTDTLIDPGEVVPSLETLFAHIAEMEAATEAANKAAAEANETIKTVMEEADAAAESLTNQVNAAIADMSAKVNVAAPSVMVDASAALVSVTDAAARDAVSVVSTIKPTVDGVSAVTLTRTGKNLLGFKDFTVSSNNVYIDIYANGLFKREIKQSHETTFVIGATAFQNILSPHIPAGTYTFTLTHMSDVTFLRPYLEVTLSDGSVVTLENGVATTLPLDGTITGARATLKQFYSGSVIEFVMQLEAGTGTAYEPYNGVTLTAALPETVYGGTLDWTDGLLTITHGADGEELAEPVTHQLDAQQLAMLKGCNAVRSDAGDTSVVYVADTKLYIDNKFTALQNAILAMGADI